MTISFDRIPQNIRTPGVYTEIDASQADTNVGLLNMRYLLLGQMIIGGAGVTPGTATLTEKIRVTSVAQARTLFGPGSMLALMVEAAIASNNWSELYCVPIQDDGTANRANGSFFFSGTATEAGTVSVYIGGRRVVANVASGATAETVATAVAAAVNAAVNLPVIAEVNPALQANVAIRAKNFGEAGNSIDLRLGYFGETLPTGIECLVSAMSGGTTNPDITDALAAVGDDWFQVIGMPYTDAANLTVLESDLDDRFGPLREIPAQAFAASYGTLGALGTLGDSRNSPHLTIVSAADEPMPAWCKAAETAAIATYYASIDPARPLQTLPYRYCLPPAKNDELMQQERSLLLYDGIATTYVGDGGTMRVERLITTYKNNAAGADDEAYLDVETLFTLMTIRHDWRNSIRTKYPRHKLADDGTRFGDGQAVVTPNVIKAEAIAKFRDWEDLGLVEGIEQYKRDLVVERSETDPNRLNVLCPPDLVNGLRVVATKIQFRL